MLAGLAESTMSRDDGWRFLVLGRSLERVDMTARLLSIQTHTPDEVTGWRTVLRACGADEAFLRTHGGTFEPQRVAEFLLLDRLFPRSALHALGTAEQCLRELAPTTERAGVTDAARRPIGQIRTRLEYADTDHPAGRAAAAPAGAAADLRHGQRGDHGPLLPAVHARHLGHRRMGWIMSWRLKIRHVTGYKYAGTVSASYNEARLTPLTLPWQTTLFSQVEVHAGAPPTYRYHDYWAHPGHRVRPAPAAPAAAGRVQQPGRGVAAAAAGGQPRPGRRWAAPPCSTRTPSC